MTEPDKPPGSGFKPITKFIAGGIVTVVAGGVAFSLETGSWLGVGVIGALTLGGGMVLWMLKLGGVFDPPADAAPVAASTVESTETPPDNPGS